MAELYPPVTSTVVKPPTFPYGHVKLSPKEPAHKDNYQRPAARAPPPQNETERDQRVLELVSRYQSHLSTNSLFINYAMARYVQKSRCGEREEGLVLWPASSRLSFK